MALKFLRLSVPQAKRALRHRVVNSTDLTSSQSSYERRDSVGQCGHDSSRHTRLQLHTIPRRTRLASILDASPASKASFSLNCTLKFLSFQIPQQIVFKPFSASPKSTVPKFRKRCENSQPGMAIKLPSFTN